jgi:hypothetical protein
MLLENLFPVLGGVGTSMLLLGILAVVSGPAIGGLVCSSGALRRIQPRGR